MRRSRAISGRFHHAAGAAVAEPARHENPVRAVEEPRAVRLLERLRFDPADVHPQPVPEAAMIERFVEALVRVFVADVLPDDVNRDLVGRVLNAMDEVFPGRHPPLGLRKVQHLENDPIEAFGREHERHLVDARHVLGGDHRLFVHVAEEGDLSLDLRVEEAIGPAEQDVRLDADGAQVADAVLRRLRLQLARRADERHQRQVNVERVLPADVLAQLADRLEEGQALDVADRAADLDDHDVDLVPRVGGRLPRDRPDALLDLVGDVRNDLDGPSQIVAAALLLDDRQVDLPGRPVVVARRHHGGEALVVAQIEVRLRAVVGDVDLSVLVRAHRARGRR